MKTLCCLLLLVGQVMGQELPTDKLPADMYGQSLPAGIPNELWKFVGDEAAFDLGRKLFFSPELSRDRTVSCASCHQPDHGWSSPDPLPRGVAGARALRHPPSLFNRGMGKLNSWDGKAPTLLKQTILPIFNPNEMALPLTEALSRLEKDGAWSRRFKSAFKDGVTDKNLATSLAAFVSRVSIGDSPIDRFRAGEGPPLTADERQGLWIFESRGACWKCHSGHNFTDEDFHNTGVGVIDGQAEPGRAGVSTNPEDRGRFKTPTLRGVALNPPYMHDGSVKTLEEVVLFYKNQGHNNPGLDPVMKTINLSDKDVPRLVAFLKALSRPAPPK